MSARAEELRADAEAAAEEFRPVLELSRKAAMNGGASPELLRELTAKGRPLIDALDRLGPVDFDAELSYGELRAEAEAAVAVEESRHRTGYVLKDEEKDPIPNPIQFLRNKLGQHDLVEVVKRGARQAEFELRFADGEHVALGDADAIQSPTKLRGRLLDAGRYCPRFTQKQLEPITACLALIARVEESGSTEAEETLSWVASYLPERALDFNRSDSADVLRVLDTHSDDPLRDGDGRVYVRLSALVQHVTRTVGQRTTSRDLAARLGRLGFKPEQLSARSGEEVRKRRFHVSEPGFARHVEEAS